MHRNFKNKLCCGVLMIFSIVISLILGEYILRIFNINFKPVTYPPDMIVFDEILGYRLEKDFKAIMRTSEFSFTIETNHKGLRDWQDSNEYDLEYSILVLGDSFTFGHGVELEETYPKILETKLNKNSRELIRVINAGMPNTGQEWQFNFLNLYLEKYPLPDLVIVGFYLNDAFDRVKNVGIKNGRMADLTRRHKIPFERKLREKSYLYWFTKNFFNKFFWKVKMEGLVRELHLYQIDYLEIIKKQWDCNEQYLEKIYKRLKSYNIPLLLIYIPDHRQIYMDEFETELKMAKLPKEEFSITKPNDLLAKWAKIKGIYYLDLYKVFRKNRDVRHYFRIDTHWNKNGHALAAQEIYNYLLEKKIIKNKI